MIEDDEDDEAEAEAGDETDSNDDELETDVVESSLDEVSKHTIFCPHRIPISVLHLKSICV